MNTLVLLDMAASARPEEPAVQDGRHLLTVAGILGAAWGGAALLEGADAIAYVGTNHAAFPVALFAAAAAGVPCIPLSYRLPEARIRELLERHGDVVVVSSLRLDGVAAPVLTPDRFLADAQEASATGAVPTDGDAPAVLLYTSGTTAAPKAALLRHRNVTAYVLGSVEFGGAGPDEAALVSVPPYHIAGVANLLSNLYLGRRIVYLPQFDAELWLRTVAAASVTHAMVVPTMLGRICDALEADAALAVPSLRALSYGGARAPVSVIERAVGLLPHVSFTNAYGLTETSSTIALLGPEDHRAAVDGDDPTARVRLASAGRVLPTVDVEVRGHDGPVAAGQPGEIWVRGEQVSGEYEGTPSGLDDGGWFPTRDRGWLDSGGYLFIEGRTDDTIIRGGENIAPAEVEEVLLTHPDVRECAVVGVPDEEWGQRIAAAIVCREGARLDAAQVGEFARARLRSARSPDEVVFVDELPYTETGKLLRRRVLDHLLGVPDAGA